MKKILIITHYIAPIQAVASIRWSKISKYLKLNHDVEIAILTDEKNYNDENMGIDLCKNDPLLLDHKDYFDKYYEVPYSFGYKLYRRKLLQFKKKANRDIGYHKNTVTLTAEKKSLKKRIKETESFLRVDYLENRIIANKIYKDIKNRDLDYDLIVSTFSPIWTHLVARKIKQKNRNIAWLADFRDSYADDVADCLVAYKYHKKFVAKYCKDADYITRVNEEMVLFENDKQKPITLYNGYDPDEKMPYCKPQKFSFVFTGLIVGDERDFTELFIAIKELCKEGKIDIEDIDFHYAGPSSDVLLGQANACGMQNIVVDHGLVSRKESLELQSHAAVLLMANPNTNTLKCEWSGKMYEYMMAEKPIVYLVSGNVPYSLPSKNIGKLDGFCYEYLRHDELHTQLKEYILDKYEYWKENGDVVANMELDYVSQFSYRNIAEKMWKIIN